MRGPDFYCKCGHHPEAHAVGGSDHMKQYLSCVVDGYMAGQGAEAHVHECGIFKPDYNRPVIAK